MESNVIIRKYDKNRVAILPYDGIKPAIARRMQAYATSRDWRDFNIIQTKEAKPLLGVACKPKTWLKFLSYLRISEGLEMPPDFNSEFERVCEKVLHGEEPQSLSHKDDLSYREKKAIHEILHRVPDAVVDEDSAEQEADKIIKD